MEYALEAATSPQRGLNICLNPCFNGICSRRRKSGQSGFKCPQVLILVLMEYALEVYNCFRNSAGSIVLILVLMEYALEVLCMQ